MFTYPKGFQCSTEDVAQWDSSYRKLEHEASQFAATLLMPLNDFRKEIDADHRPNLSERLSLAMALDEMVLECIVNSGHEQLITHNVKDFYTAAEQFNIRVLTPGQLLKEMIE